MMGDKTGTETTPIGEIPFTIAAPLDKGKKKVASGREKIKKVPAKKFARLQRAEKKPEGPASTVTPGGAAISQEDWRKGIMDKLENPPGTHHTEKKPSKRKQSPAARKATMENLQKARAALKARQG